MRNHDDLFDGVYYAPAGNFPPMSDTDPDFTDIFIDFAFDEVYSIGKLDKRTRFLLILASMIAQNTRPRYKVFLAAALKAGVTPAEVKELVYQCIPYCGIARVFDIIYDTNEVFAANGVALPVESRAAVTREDRFSKGLAAQKAIFGDVIEGMRANAPDDQKHIQDLLSANCFGDYYTRGGLELRERELITFAVLLSLGGCEAQLKGHVKGNINVGNGREKLIDAATQLLPYVGYPRVLNALGCVNEVTGVPEK